MNLTVGMAEEADCREGSMPGRGVRSAGADKHGIHNESGCVGKCL